MRLQWRFLHLRVSTHSRPKAAGQRGFYGFFAFVVSTHSRPKAAGGALESEGWQYDVSTHSRPKAAGGGFDCGKQLQKFQLTAARRRLESPPAMGIKRTGFNSQPPEGGWAGGLSNRKTSNSRFNSQPPEGGWKYSPGASKTSKGFNSQPPEGGWRGVNPDVVQTQDVSTHSRPKAAGVCLL